MQLRSWTPRRPSKRVEAQLFGRPLPQAEPLLVVRLGWLVPATMAFVLMCALFNPRSAATLGRPEFAAPMVAMILSNQSAAAYLPASFQRDQNSPAGTFEWTNAGALTPALQAPSPFKGNH